MNFWGFLETAYLLCIVPLLVVGFFNCPFYKYMDVKYLGNILLIIWTLPGFFIFINFIFLVDEDFPNYSYKLHSVMKALSFAFYGLAASLVIHKYKSSFDFSGYSKSGVYKNIINEILVGFLFGILILSVLGGVRSVAYYLGYAKYTPNNELLILMENKQKSSIERIQSKLDVCFKAKEKIQLDDFSKYKYRELNDIFASYSYAGDFVSPGKNKLIISFRYFKQTHRAPSVFSLFYEFEDENSNPCRIFTLGFDDLELFKKNKITKEKLLDYLAIKIDIMKQHKLDVSKKPPSVSLFSFASAYSLTGFPGVSIEPIGSLATILDVIIRTILWLVFGVYLAFIGIKKRNRGPK